MNYKINKFLENAVHDGVFPGCCCAIIQNDETQYYCVGNKSLEPRREENQIDTLYDLASLTKVVGTLPLILKLIQNNLLQYETKISDIIPSFKNNQITILDLLTHRSGLPSDLNWGIHIGKMKMISDICEYSQNVEPNQEVIYSDLGFMMLGYIAEIITHQSLDELIQKYVLTPLHMNNTFFQPAPFLKEKCAPTEKSLYFHRIIRGEVHDRKAHCMNGISGHAGLFSNIFDLEKYVRMILKYGMNDNEIYLKQNFIEDMYTNFTCNLNIARGVGFLTFDNSGIFSSLNSQKTIVHTGFTGTSILIDIENQVAIILLSNRVHPTRENTLILQWRKKWHEFVMESISN